MACPDSTPIKLAILPSDRAASAFLQITVCVIEIIQSLFTNIAAGDGPLEVVGILGDHLLDDVHLLHEQLHRVGKLGVAADVR